MTNDEIFEASLPILLDSLFPESIEAAHDKAKENYKWAVQALNESLNELKTLRAEPRTAEQQAEIEGVRISIRHTVRELKFLRMLRTKLVRVLRVFPTHENGERVLPYSSEGRPSATPQLKKAVLELTTCLMPYLVPTAAVDFAGFVNLAKMYRKEMNVEHQLAEEWKSFFPDIFYGFTIEPPLCLPSRENHPLARDLFDRITSTQILSRNELLLLEKGLLG